MLALRVLVAVAGLRSVDSMTEAGNDLPMRSELNALLLNVQLEQQNYRAGSDSSASQAVSKVLDAI